MSEPIWRKQLSEIADEMVALAANARRERLRDSGPCTPDVQHDVEASAMRAALDAIAPAIYAQGRAQGLGEAKEKTVTYQDWCDPFGEDRNWRVANAVSAEIAAIRKLKDTPA